MNQGQTVDHVSWKTLAAAVRVLTRSKKRMKPWKGEFPILKRIMQSKLLLWKMPTKPMATTPVRATLNISFR